MRRRRWSDRRRSLRRFLRRRRPGQAKSEQRQGALRANKRPPVALHSCLLMRKRSFTNAPGQPMSASSGSCYVLELIGYTARPQHTLLHLVSACQPTPPALPSIPDTSTRRSSAPSASPRDCFLLFLCAFCDLKDLCVKSCRLSEKSPDAPQHLHVHRRRQQSRLRILLARVINAKQPHSRFRKIHFRTLRESIPPPPPNRSPMFQYSQHS